MPAFTSSRPLALVGVSAALLVALARPARTAAACGGFFCDVDGNVPQPVDQTGEKILLVVDREQEQIEAHIQIAYTGDPDKFAWVIRSMRCRSSRSALGKVRVGPSNYRAAVGGVRRRVARPQTPARMSARPRVVDHRCLHPPAAAAMVNSLDS